MSRTLIVAAMTLLAALGAGQVMAAKETNTALRLSVPTNVDGATSVAVTVRVPGNVGAVDGRLFYDTSAAQVIGVAPLGPGTALAPVDIAGGSAFGAYGLAASGGWTTLRIVIAPLTPGVLNLRLVIDSASDGRGKRVSVGQSKTTGAIRVAGDGTPLASPRDAAPLRPLRAAGPTRALVGDRAISRDDLDVARADWEAARANGTECATPGADDGDANGDGCVDIVDLQALAAGQTSSKLGTQPRSPSDGAFSTAAAAQAGAQLTFVVTSTADTPDATNGDGLCGDSQGRCTLRAAITESNWQPGDNLINFNLPGTAPVVIQLSGNPVPIIHDRSGGLFIDGYSQPGSRANTATAGSNAIPGVELRGTAGSPRGNAFRVTSSGNTIRGFLINNTYDSIFFDGPDAHDNTVAGNLIGFTRAGAVHSYDGHHGVRLNQGAHDNHIGTPALADRNVIGNATHGIDLYGPGTDNNVIQNNDLCMTPSGTGQAVCSTGIDHNFGPKNNLHGGLGQNERNVIGRTRLNGIEISHGWDPDGKDTTTKWQNNGNRVVGNWIGFRGDGSYNAGFRSGQNAPNNNDANGVNVYDGSNYNIVDGNWIASVYDGVQTMSPNSTGNIIRNNVIGESPLGQAAPLNRYGIVAREHTKTHFIEGNTIRNAGVYGIGLVQKDVLWVRISRNIITDMSGPAIYLAPDPNDSSKGANNRLAAPRITSATTITASGTGIAGATVEVYRASRSAGQSGLPIQYLASAVVAANGSWTAPIVVQSGQRVVALQINEANNTSALGVNVTATFEAPPPAPVAQFAWSQQASTLTVDFTDQSTNTPAQWSWNFGDGTTSTAQNPSKTYAQAGQYAVSLTVTNGGGTGSVTSQVTVQPLPTSAPYAADGFGRTVSGWTSADIGGAYTLQGNAANFAVANGVGTIQMPKTGTTQSALLNGVSQRDVDILVRVSLDKVAAGGNYFVYAVARRNTNNEYRPRVILNANGSVSVNASVVIGGTESPLGNPVTVAGLNQAANSFIWLRAQVVGASPTTIRVKAWANGQAEPTSWQFTATDSKAAVQVAGAVGLRFYLGKPATNAPVSISIDDYLVTPGS